MLHIFLGLLCHILLEGQNIFIMCFGDDFWANWLSFMELSWGCPKAHGESYDEVVRIGMT